MFGALWQWNMMLDYCEASTITSDSHLQVHFWMYIVFSLKDLHVLIADDVARGHTDKLLRVIISVVIIWALKLCHYFQGIYLFCRSTY